MLSKKSQKNLDVLMGKKLCLDLVKEEVIFSVRNSFLCNMESVPLPKKHFEVQAACIDYNSGSGCKMFTNLPKKQKTKKLKQFFTT